LRWRAFPLHPETPQQGRRLEDLFAGRDVHLPSMLRHLRQTAATLGLPFGERTMTFNSRRAQELGKYAEERGRGEAFHRAVFHAYFAEGLNIARIEVLADVARRVGLSAQKARQALQSGAYGDPVDADWALARRRGVTAVPTLEAAGGVLVGAQPWERMEALLLQAGARRRS
jgi:predicted DsbA family dithiol-disulfide isomerase